MVKTFSRPFPTVFIPTQEGHSRLSKFEKKVDEGFLFGYSTSRKTYRVYKKTHNIVEEVQDVEFDETNDSQVENENMDDD